MDWTQILGSMTGGVLGFAGGIIQKLVGMREKRLDHEMELKRIEATSVADAKKTQAQRELTEIEKSWESFKSAIDAQANSKGSSPWVQDFVSAFRPGYTLFLTVLTLVAFFFVDYETKNYIALSFISLASTAGGYWFGTRTDQKLANIKLKTK